MVPNLEPYVPLLTALFTFANTALLVWNQVRLQHLKKRVNGMYLQSLADAEERGRGQALTGGVVARSVPGDTAPPGESPPSRRLTNADP